MSCGDLHEEARGDEWAPSLQAGSHLPGCEQGCGPPLEVQPPAASQPGRTGLQSACGEAVLAERRETPGQSRD